MFANKYLDKQIRHKCEVFNCEAMLCRICKPLILCLYDAHTVVAAATNMHHSE